MLTLRKSGTIKITRISEHPFYRVETKLTFAIIVQKVARSGQNNGSIIAVIRLLKEII